MQAEYNISALLGHHGRCDSSEKAAGSGSGHVSSGLWWPVSCSPGCSWGSSSLCPVPRTKLWSLPPVSGQVACLIINLDNGIYCNNKLYLDGGSRHWWRHSGSIILMWWNIYWKLSSKISRSSIKTVAINCTKWQRKKNRENCQLNRNNEKLLAFSI